MSPVSGRYPRIRITRLYKLMLLSMARTFRSSGLTVTNGQEIILRALKKSGGLSQTEPAAMTGQDKNNLSRTIAILEKRGYVLKTSCERDRRYCRVSLTAEGDAVHKQIGAVLERWRDSVFFHGIELEDLDRFAATAEKMMRSFEEQLTERPSDGSGAASVNGELEHADARQ